MKKNIYKTTFFILLLSFGCMDISNGQSFQKGQTDLNIGIGLGNPILGPDNYNTITPLSISLGYGITNDISIGIYGGFSGASYNYYGWDDCGMGHGNGQYFTDTYKWSYYILGVQGDYHFGRFIKRDKWDVYAGLLLGNDFAHYTYYTNSVCPDHIRYDSPMYGGIVCAIHAGARYRITNHVGVFAELGYGIAYLNVGVNFKF
ncbi:MAG TPA: hypothetical protein VNZ86_06820 [Bacteroidia bacterium]|jgi:hypothetical protein|nr:hypothetical protein [Bacteroidia bacterium]